MLVSTVAHAQFFVNLHANVTCRLSDPQFPLHEPQPQTVPQGSLLAHLMGRKVQCSTRVK